MTRWFGRIGLLCFSMLVGLLLLEGVWRLVWSPTHSPLNNPVYCEYSETLGWKHIPGATARHVAEDFSVEVKINAIGLRDRERTAARSPGIYRILTVGDSLTFGFGVEAPETFSSLLEGSLPNTEVLNGGVCGYGNDQTMLYLEASGFDLNPDLLVLTLCANDVEENLRCTMYGREKPCVEAEGGELVVRNQPVPNPLLCRVSHLYRSLNKHLWTWRREPLSDAEKKAGVARMRQILGRIAKRARARGIEFVVCKTTGDLALPDREDGYHVLDLSARLGAEKGLTFEHDPHWNADGHRFVAGLIEDFLVERALIPVTEATASREVSAQYASESHR